MDSKAINKESGNVLWIILIGIVMLGALTVLVTRSSSTVNQSGDVEQNRVRAGQIMRYADSISKAVEQLQLQGISESDISFENIETGTTYQNGGGTCNECKIFHVEGAGLAYLSPPAGSNDGTEWVFTGDLNAGSTDSPLGTTATRTGNDLIMLLPNANQSLCVQINRELKIGTPGTLPVDQTGIGTPAPFTGTYANALTIIDGDSAPMELDGKRGGCFIDSNPNPDVTYFYYVVLAR